MHLGHEFIITGWDFERNEIPLVTVHRKDVRMEIGDDYIDECETKEGYESLEIKVGCYSIDDERPYGRFPSTFISYTNWGFSPFPYYAWNIPNVPIAFETMKSDGVYQEGKTNYRCSFNLVKSGSAMQPIFFYRPRHGCFPDGKL
jgi:hypothetical protein